MAYPATAVLSVELAHVSVTLVSDVCFAKRPAGTDGGVESLITYPAVQTHADMDPATRERLGINDRLLRLSVGIEDVGDLIRDLEAVL